MIEIYVKYEAYNLKVLEYKYYDKQIAKNSNSKIKQIILLHILLTRYWDLL